MRPCEGEHEGACTTLGVVHVPARVCACITATRLVNSRTAAELGHGSAAAYTGPFDVIRQTVQAEGIKGVYRGSVANYLRFGPCTSARDRWRALHGAQPCPEPVTGERADRVSSLWPCACVLVLQSFSSHFFFFHDKGNHAGCWASFLPHSSA